MSVRSVYNSVKTVETAPPPDARAPLNGKNPFPMPYQTLTFKYRSSGGRIKPRNRVKKTRTKVSK